MQLHENFAGHSETKTGSNRSFGLVMAIFFVLVGVVPLLRGGSLRPSALGVAAALTAVTWLAPQWLTPFNKIWTKLGLLLGKMVNPIVLTLLYWIAFTPMAFLLRMLGKDPLRLKWSVRDQTYWIKRELRGITPESMRREF